MSIIGVSNTPDTEYFDRTKSEKIAIKTAGGLRISRCGVILLECARRLAVRQHQHHRSTTAAPRACRELSLPSIRPIPVDQHLLHLLWLSGLQAGRGNRLSRELRRRYPPPGGGLPHGRSHRLAACRLPRKVRARSCSPATWIRPTSSSRWRRRFRSDTVGCGQTAGRHHRTGRFPGHSARNSHEDYPFLLGALLSAAPVFSQQALWSDPRVGADGVKWFEFVEREAEVRQYLGQPAMVADFGKYRSWQYQIGEVEHDDFSHALVFRKSDGVLVSISRITIRSAAWMRSFPRVKPPFIGSVLQGRPTSRCG